MKNIIILFLSVFTICSCVDKHPYKYTINEDIKIANKEILDWRIEEVVNGTTLPMLPEKKIDLTNKIINYLNTKGFQAALLSSAMQDKSDIYFTVKPKIIETMAQISQNEAGWHGTSEDPLNFWSHFSAGISAQTVRGSVPALSLYVEIYSGDQKYFENAGGIELVGKYNKYSFRTTIKDELLADDGKFQNAMDIAFKPLLEAVK